ncbi:tetratricopeptide repeat protein [Dongia deserti]|uniref:tetratricopeptide repeat protein n=1 Tax=Dongia deserti TaxID=2268030 RepID=UPI0013C4FBAE|nr:tetratricopeptide repeat protein [Dongia deserti]
MAFDDPVERGRGLVATGQFGSAIETLTEVVHDDPRNVRALNLLAVTYANLKRFDLADRYHQQALQVDPNSVAALNNLGYSHLVRGDTAQAIGLLERAAAVGDGNQVVAANLGLATGRDNALATRPIPQPAPLQAEQSIRLSEHVTLVRRAGQLQRIAPGVQLLITNAPSVAPEPEPGPATAVSSIEGSSPDPRHRLFRELFALFDGEQVADASTRTESSSFLHVSDVDDFSVL